MRQIKCPVCNAPAKNSPPELALVPCHQCGLTWTFIEKAIDAEALYEDEVYAVVDNRKSIFEKIIFGEAKKVIATVSTLLGHEKKTKVLDFGSGKGQFLVQAKLSGWETLGIETSPSRAAFAQEKYGLEIQTGFYQGGKINTGEFDLITLFHVLEHLPEPVALLHELTNKNLSKSGVLVIEVPNYGSWQSRIAAKDWMHLDIPRHLSHWTADQLKNQMKTIGFIPVKQQGFSIHLGVLGMLRAILGKFGYRGNIIFDLKNRRKPLLLASILVTLPLAFVLESLSTLFQKGGVLRIYFRKD
ncbi:hypothetical protein P872_10530 [Rhodonellum psychrophilum GCM71 = DSM 17998]|uniref:Methyltransferase n=2 Tax=Rhodonellum TaxID=336827 RepID=U5BXG9_9BACT|nr:MULTISPECIES: class I SAM-dependent methyltransferase [Rhodonellum]ERM81311.1 hypothetical protein P872_10530 [Rhodonellum psychrophilum GCM71 = DSM 17998]